MATAVQIPAENRAAVLQALQALSTQSAGNRKLTSKIAVYAQMILQNLVSKTDSIERARNALVSAQDPSQLNISQQEAQDLVALMQANTPSKGWFGWLTRSDGSSASGGVGSGFAAQAASVLSQTLERFVPGWDRVTRVIEDQGPALATTLTGLGDELQPRVNRMITDAIAMLTGEAKISLENWERVQLQVKTIINFLETGNGCSRDQVQLNKDHLITFTEQLLNGSDQELGFTLSADEAGKLRDFCDFLVRLNLEDADSLVQYRRAPTPNPTNASGLEGDEARPLSRQGSALASEAGDTPKPPIHPLTEGLDVIKGLEKRYVSLLARIGSSLKAEPKKCYLEYCAALQFLLQQLERSPDEGDIELSGKDAEMLLGIEAAIEAATKEPGLNDKDGVLAGLQFVVYSKERGPLLCRAGEGAKLTITPDMRRMQDAKIKIKAACDFFKGKITEESGFVFLATEQGGLLFQQSENYIRDKLFKRPEEKRLLEVLEALQALKRLNPQDSYVRSEAEREIIRLGIKAARDLNGDMTKVQFTQVEGAVNFQGRIRGINGNLAQLGLRYGWLGSWFSYPHVVGLLESDLRKLQVLDAAITDYSTLMRENGEGLATRVERQGHEAARFASSEVRSLLDFTLWKVVKTVVVIGVAFIAFDFALYILRRRVYDLALSMLPLRAF